VGLSPTPGPELNESEAGRNGFHRDKRKSGKVDVIVMKPVYILGAAVIGGILYLFSEDEKTKPGSKEPKSGKDQDTGNPPLTKSEGANPTLQKEVGTLLPIQDTDEEIRELRRKLRHATNSRKKSRSQATLQ